MSAYVSYATIRLIVDIDVKHWFHICMQYVVAYNNFCQRNVECLPGFGTYHAMTHSIK